MDQPVPKSESKVEGIKKSSRHLRGTIADTIAAGLTHFTEDDTTLLKFHGVYQQDDRDIRQERRKAGLEEAYSFMVRCAIPAGVLTSQQLVSLLDIGEKYANGTIRVTTRQGIQYHGVLMGNLKKNIAGINKALLTTLSACGDVERNVMACSAPLHDPAHVLVRKLAREIATQLRPATHAYHEIWLDDEKHLSTEQEEPFYGDHYLPRKFKTAISMSDDNCVDVYNNDAGLIAVIEGDKVAGFNVLVGGGMGMTHGKADTVARLAEPVGYVATDHGVEAIRTIAAIFRDFGNRADRRHARIKYLINERGIEWFRDEFRRRALFDLHDSRPLPRPHFHDHLGRHSQDDGQWFYGLYIENGRVADREDAQLKSALRTIATHLNPGVTLTAQQNILLTGLTQSGVTDLEQMLLDHGVTPTEKLSGVRRFSMACPALPTCGLAMAESERLMPSVVDMFEHELTLLGLRDAPFTMRMTGCPNGCARPYTADISFVGRRPDVYHVYVGGGMEGDRAVDLFAADVSVADLVPLLRPLLQKYAIDRRNGENLSDFYHRLMGHTETRRSITGRENPTKDLVQLAIAR